MLSFVQRATQRATGKCQQEIATWFAEKSVQGAEKISHDALKMEFPLSDPNFKFLTVALAKTLAKVAEKARPTDMLDTFSGPLYPFMKKNLNMVVVSLTSQVPVGRALMCFDLGLALQKLSAGRLIVTSGAIAPDDVQSHCERIGAAITDAKSAVVHLDHAKQIAKSCLDTPMVTPLTLMMDELITQSLALLMESGVATFTNLVTKICIQEASVAAMGLCLKTLDDANEITADLKTELLGKVKSKPVSGLKKMLRIWVATKTIPQTWAKLLLKNFPGHAEKIDEFSKSLDELRGGAAMKTTLTTYSSLVAIQSAWRPLKGAEQRSDVVTAARSAINTALEDGVVPPKIQFILDQAA